MENPAQQGALVKELGNNFEQVYPEIARRLVPAMATHGGSPFEQEMAGTVPQVPSYSLRGGTREIMRGIIARGLGLR